MEIMDQVKKGTTTVGLICDGGVVLASEKRATMGSFIASKAAKKIYQLDDRIGITTAGVVGDAQALIRVIRVEGQLYKIRRDESMTVRAVATLLSNVMRGHRPKWCTLILNRSARRQYRGEGDRSHRLGLPHCLRCAGGSLHRRYVSRCGNGTRDPGGALGNEARQRIGRGD
jgi:hypothetical protein